MALVTGTPLGTINAQDDIYLDTAPSLWFQDFSADELNNPDGDGFSVAKDVLNRIFGPTFGRAGRTFFGMPAIRTRRPESPSPAGTRPASMPPAQ